MMKRSLRWRLAWTFMLLTTFAVLIQAVALFVSTEEREEDLIDEVVNTALDEQAKSTAGGASDDAHHLSSRMRLFRLAGNQVPPGMPPHLASVKPGNYEWVTGDIEYHVGIRQRNGERLYLLYDASEHEERLDQMFWNLLIGLVFLSLLSLWVGYWLSERMLYQFGKIIRRLGQDDEGKLNEPGFDREVALLAGALDDYRQRNRELLAREREFTSNVSHELRTPLTRIRTGAELFAEDAALSERARDRAQRIIKAADDMESRLRGLLFLARELAPAERQRVDLRQCVESCAAHFRAQCDAAGVRLDIDISAGTLVDADRSLLQLLLENLIGNATRHTAEGSIEISYRDGVLAVADTGSGIPPEHLANVFQRYYRASNLPGGLGLGLSIVKRVCDAHGWKCTVESGEGRKGTKVSVALNEG
ncbi:HAMP domain-containing histidine kinase [Herbaspirillum sp. HC18]|nr:HAMP domain-containing histidine kinase [Herbaspirillum sp. HC18]